MEQHQKNDINHDARWNCPWVKVGDVQVFTADYTFQQWQALMSMHDRNRRIAITALVIGILGVCISLAALLVH